MFQASVDDVARAVDIDRAEVAVFAPDTGFGGDMVDGSTSLAGGRDDIGIGDVALSLFDAEFVEGRIAPAR